MYKHLYIYKERERALKLGFLFFRSQIEALLMNLWIVIMD